MFVGLMRVINFVVCNILYGLMMMAVFVAASANLAIFHRNIHVILSNAEIGNIIDCNKRDWAFKGLWRRGSACGRLNLLEVQFSSSGETNR